jgi:hypothetical protein
MIQIASDNVTSALRLLFRTDEPQACRCFAVLDGIDHAGKIILELCQTECGVYDGCTQVGAPDRERISVHGLEQIGGMMWAVYRT